MTGVSNTRKDVLSIANKNNYSIEEQIKVENSKLQKIFKDIPELQRKTVETLIQNASFLSVTLKRLQESINSGEMAEEYQNGVGQSGRKCTSELQTYNNLIKDYSSIISKLLKLLPKDAIEEDDGFEAFLRGRD